MANSVGGIFVDLGLNSAAFSKGLTTAQGQVQKFSASTKSSLGQLGKGVFGGLAQGALSTIAPILGLAAAVNTLKAGLKEFGDISDNAKASGLDAEFFQGLAYQAGLGGVSVEQLASSLSGFNRASGQAEAGTGRMAAALAKLNPELLRNIQSAKTQEERVRLAADAIANAGSASEKAALSVALFGDSGTKLADVFSGGAAAIDAAMKKAQDLGLVIDRDLIAKADQLGDEFDTATKVLDLQFKAALVGLAPILTGTADLIGGVVMAVRGLIEQFSALDDRSTSSLEDRLQQIKEIQATIGTDVILPDGQIVPANPMAVSVGGGDTVKLAEEAKQIESVLALRKALEVPPPAATGDGGGYNAIAQETIDKARGVLDALKFEADQLGRTAEQQAIFNNLKAAGVTAESAYGLQIASATVELERQKVALAENAAAMAEIESVAKDVLGGFINDLRSGESAVDALGNAFDRLADKLLDASIGGILNAILPGSGTLATSLFADGGIAAHGRRQPLPRFAGGGVSRSAAIFGEAGPEAAVPLPDGRRIPVDLRMPSAMNSGGSPGGGTIVISLSDGLEGRILAAAGQQTIKIVDQRTPSIVKQVAPGAVRIANGNRTG